jgi:hypothetical protein
MGITKEQKAFADAIKEGFPIVGWEDLTRIFRKHKRTLKKWMREDEFPILRLPDGTPTTTVPILEKWLIESQPRIIDRLRRSHLMTLVEGPEEVMA